MRRLFVRIVIGTLYFQGGLLVAAACAGVCGYDFLWRLGEALCGLVCVRGDAHISTVAAGLLRVLVMLLINQGGHACRPVVQCGTCCDCSILGLHL